MNYLLTTALLLGFGLPSARACDCVWLSMRENYRKADFVLRVHVESIQDTVQVDLYSNPVRPPFAAGAQVTVRVQQVYKGAPHARRLSIRGMGSLCDYRFLRGSDYVVFLYKQDVDSQGQYVTSTCQRHFNLRDAAAGREFTSARLAEK